MARDDKTPLLSDEARDGFDQDDISFPGETHSEEAALGPPPSDGYNIGYLIFFLQGVGCLFPWNAFITVQGYFHEKLKGSAFEDNFINYFSFGFQFANISMLYIANKYQSNFSMESRILYPMIIQFLIYVGITAMVKLDVTGDTFFYVTLVLVMVSAGCTAFYQGGLFGFSAMLPPKYTQALMAGQGLGGIAVAVLNVVTILVYPSQDHDDIISSAFLFFMVALFVALSCIFTFPILTKLKFVQHKRATVAISVRRASSSNLRAVNSIQKQNSEGMCGEIERPIKAIAPLAFQVGYVFFVTLSVFPAIAAAVKSQYANDYGTKLFVPIFCFVGFNVGDYVGRTLVTFAQWPSLLTRARMWVPVLLRTAFIPLFMMCNLDLGSGVTDYFPKSLGSSGDVVPYVLMLLLGISNGYYGTLCMMYGPGIVREEHREWAGSTMLFCLVVGLACGSFFSFAIRAILCHCNPFVGGASANTTNNSFAFGPHYDFSQDVRDW